MHDTLLDSLSAQIQTRIMPFLQDSKAEASAHIQHLIKTILAKEGLVTREMFDVQSALLVKARLKLEVLETQLNNYLAGKAGPDG